MRALLVVRQAAAQGQVGSLSDMPGRVRETGIFFILGFEEDERKRNDIRRDGVGSELRHQQVLRIDRRLLVRVEAPDQPLQPIVVRRRETELLRELIRARRLEKLKAQRTG